MANKGGGIRKSSGSDQDGFSDQNQTVAPSCTDADSASDSDTAVLAAVKEGREVKARTDREVIRPRDGEYTSLFRNAQTRRVAWSETQNVLRAPQPPRHQVVTDEVVSDEDYRDSSMLSLFKRDWRKRSR